MHRDSIECGDDRIAASTAGGDVYAYVTGPICIECGGGGPATRQTYLTVVDVLARTVEVQHLISEATLSSISEGDIDSCADPDLEPLANVGMAFSADRTKLFVANPDQDRVEVLDTATQTLGTPIAVGPRPVDVATVVTAGAFGEERAYVVERGTQPPRISIIDVTILMIDDNPIELSLGGAPTAIAALSNGTRLFLTDPANESVLVVDVDTDNVDGTENRVINELAVGPAPHRVVLMRLPGS